MRLRLYTLVLCTALVLSGSSGRLRADNDRASASQARPAAATPAAAPAADPFPGLKFRNIGPATMGGRIDDLAVLESNPAVFYVGTATGGLWKTMNNGTTWEVLFDDLDDTVSIGDVAINPNDANTVWVGSGENNNRQSGSWGNGVYKSIDGGKTFKHMGLATSKHIARIIVDPIDHDVVYVAALGSLWGGGGERGVYKTTDGGLTWTRILFVNDDTGATELVMDPSNNKVIYAATYQRRRATWGFNGGGPGSAMWKSSDAGRTWTKLTGGVPTGPLGRIGMDVYRASPNIIYARIEHAKESGTYRSDDAGLNWRKMSDTNPRPMYFSQIRIDPNNDSRLYVLGVDLSISDDGGKTFFLQESLHDDHHAMWINPANSNHVISGTDGGIGISYDKAKTYEAIYNMDLGQFYHVTYDMETPYNVCGGLQDNYTWCGPSAVRSRTGISNDQWFQIQGGDGFEAQIDPKDSRTIYAESQDGNIVRIDRVSNERKAIRPLPARGEAPYRWNWNTPILISPHDSNTIYVGANKVFKSTNRGHSWTAISGELTENTNRETLSLMGVKAEEFEIAKHDGVQSYGNIVQLVESPKTAGVLYAGTDDGKVHMTRDGGKTWTDITTRFPNVPKNSYVSRLVPSAHEVNVVYASFDNHRADDMNTYVYASVDGGNNFRSIGEGIPKGHAVMSMAEDPKNPNVLYSGSEFGLFVSPNRGGTWTRIKSNVPTVPIHEIVFHPRDNDMILATHGRSIWILDDLTPLQQYPEAIKSDAFLFDMRPAAYYNQANDRGFIADKPFFGRNPTYGAPISFYLAKNQTNVALRIRDAAGAQVREITGNDMRESRGAGVNRVYWDLRHQPLPAVAGQQGGGGGGGGFGGGGNNGPNVLPGDYRVTLVVDGKDVATKTLRVNGDKDMPMTDADRRAWHDTALNLHEMQRVGNAAAEAVTTLAAQLTAAETLMKSAANPPSSAKTAITDASTKLADLRRRLGLNQQGGGGGGGGGFGGQQANVRGQLGQTKGSIMGSTSLPTEQQVRAAGELREDLMKVIADTNELIAAIPAIYDALGASGAKPAALKPVGPIPANR
ncbi:MAG: glycosyl hydrolase [Cyanobacteria bacterium]|nr:glycosyl hydrolase [Cyanobacteriota bacterium]